MNSQTRRKTSEVFSRYWPWFFFTAAFESLCAIIALLLIPSEGLSVPRLGLLGILGLFAIGGFFLGWRSGTHSLSLDWWTRPAYIYGAALLALTSSLLLFLLRYLNPAQLLPYYERLSPLLWYLVVLGVQAVVFLLLIRNGFQLQHLLDRKAVYRFAFMGFLILLATLVFVAITGVGVTPDASYWGEPGVAIQGWQFALALLAGFVALLYVSNGAPERFSNILLPSAIYLLAAGLWLSVPMNVLENSFYAPISPPANMPFPYSDAGFYDYLSQSLLIGTDYLGGIPPRPLYVTFLAFMHLLFGQNYPAIITVQTLILALFPVTLYFLGKRLHSPAAGLTVAMLAIFRELVALWISSNTRVANSRIFTTDFPTAMGIAALCLVVIWWFERRDLRATIIAGGAFGLLLLFRTQSLFTLPVVFALAWFVYARKTAEWIKAGIVFACAMAIAVLPWLVHNRMVSGVFSFDDPAQMAIIYSQYSFNEGFNLQEFDIHSTSLGARMLEFTLQNPVYVGRFIVGHFLNTEIGGLLSLPLIKDFNGLREPVDMYWVGWDGTLEWYNLLLIILYLAIIAVGLGAARRRAGWLGFVPLAFNLGYALANGVSRFSSWRYNLPVDWVIYFYFAIGFIEIFYGLSLAFGSKTMPESEDLPSNGPIAFKDFRSGYVFILLAFALMGSLPWLAKGIASPRYTATDQELVARLSSAGYAAAEIDAFLEQPGAVLMEGRLLYPRMYRREEGIFSANPWAAYVVKDYARMGFIMINERQYSAIFITRDLLDFPQGADATLLGCQRDGYIEVRIIDFGDKVFESAPLGQPCD